MRIQVNDLRDRNEPLVVESEWTESQMPGSDNLARLSGPATYSMALALEGEKIQVRGRVAAPVELTCCRCLQPFPVEVDKQFAVEYRRDPEVEHENQEFELDYEDLDVGFYRDGQLDIGNIVSEQVFLDLPMKPVCQSGCQGLCDQCGANLNKGMCGCVRESVDPRWAALADWKKTH